MNPLGPQSDEIPIQVVDRSDFTAQQKFKNTITGVEDLNK